MSRFKRRFVRNVRVWLCKMQNVLRSLMVKPEQTPQGAKPFDADDEWREITDGTGVPFRLVCHSDVDYPEFVVWSVAENGEPKEKVGYMEIDLHLPNEVRIADLRIYDPSLRRHGLGSCLLQEATRLAREVGAKQVQGRVNRNDLEQTPHLLEWYRNHGFVVELLNCGRYVATITFHLS